MGGDNRNHVVSLRLTDEEHDALMLAAARQKSARSDVLRKLVVCPLVGCDFGDVLFTGNSLVFCRRCGAEILGRTFDDLEPMTAEEKDLWDRLNG